MKTSFSNKIATVPHKAKAKSNDNDYEYECTIPLVSVPNETVSKEELAFFFTHSLVKDGDEWDCTFVLVVVVV